ncbi:transposase [Tropicimonas sediminicola]|uniref:transposase n=1 Tax=Tropicimonas sediminicola TaxID=1031541 RepID=UPI003CCC2DBE
MYWESPLRASLHSKNPIERLNGEINRHTDGVVILPNNASTQRLEGAVLLQ